MNANTSKQTIENLPFDGAEAKIEDALSNPAIGNAGAAASGDTEHQQDIGIETAVEPKDAPVEPADTSLDGGAAAPAIVEVEDDAEDPDDGEEFKRARKVKGEIMLTAGEIGVWEHHLRRNSRVRSAHAAALALTAGDPLAIAPIEVIRNAEGRYVVKDGRFRLQAILDASGGDMTVMVRCVVFAGTQAEAMQEACDDALGLIGASAIEQAQALLSLKRISNISQTAIAERYPGLTIPKVSNMLIAARLREVHPILFDILVEPDRAPIDYGVKLNKLKKALGPGGFQMILDRAEELFAAQKPVQPVQALAALQATSPGDTVEDGDAAATAPEAVSEPEAVFGFNDEQVGTAVELPDGALRLDLPTREIVNDMSVAEREEAAAAFVAKVRTYFGLEVES